ncbi:MAG: thiazole synthase [Candidatus Saganbacteria bacterium]|uniref:thiazole synthase n=1 Tax=Candidatus Saganbacteria bacterium TaxID=2575572 RepID=A0A833L1S5_UNCSA|nr:MAG: thiazole synthase [Candidatus Saganbacteria bacterium]
MDKPFIIAGKELKSRFLLGTGKFGSKEILRDTIIQSGTEAVTVALRRIDLNLNEENILFYIPKDIILLTNTSGARNAKEAIRIARLAREAGYGNWIKIEVINDCKYLLPDNAETIKATEVLAGEGFIILPYMHPDLYAARALVKAGAAAVMPLGSLIGSNLGLEMKMMIKILINEIDEVPIIVDAGIGVPVHAAQAMELGADAILVNTAVATAADPAKTAKAFAEAVISGRAAYLSKTANQSFMASASSPLTGYLHDQ